mmetsp:Transcript_35083/g.79084  ORF Transcript_35083/g.79084 Transcript_35083/m.79084 type:complete len:407 (+) Transcript_35083:56-1276(+)
MWSEVTGMQSMSFLIPGDIDIRHRKAPLDQRRPVRARRGAESTPLLKLIGKNSPVQEREGTPSGGTRRRRQPVANSEEHFSWQPLPRSSSISTSGFLAKVADRIGSQKSYDWAVDGKDTYGSRATSSSSLHPASWPLESVRRGEASSRHASVPAGSAACTKQNAEADEHAVKSMSFSLNIPVDVVWQACEMFIKYSEQHASKGPPANAGTVHRGLDLPMPSRILVSDRLSRKGFAQVLRELMACAPSEEPPDGIVAEAFQYADRDGGGDLDFHAFVIWLSSHGFAGYLNTSPAQRALRKLAEKHGMDAEDVERYKRHFDEVDSEGEGILLAKDFKTLLQKCAKVPAAGNTAGFRVDRFWRMADKKNRGEIDFEQFLTFCRNHFDSGSDGAAFETYYRGIRRVGLVI